MQFETFMLTEVIITIKPFLAFALEYLSESSLCHAFTVPAGTI